MGMAQCSHECDHFNTVEEYASGAAYEGRSDLGNTQPGDGRRFKGRGYIQLTGRANYIDVGRAIGEDLVNNPTRASEPAIAAKVALHFWKTRVRRRVSNFCDTNAVTRVINEEQMGWLIVNLNLPSMVDAVAVVAVAAVAAAVVVT